MWGERLLLLPPRTMTLDSFFSLLLLLTYPKFILFRRHAQRGVGDPPPPFFPPSLHNVKHSCILLSALQSCLSTSLFLYLCPHLCWPITATLTHR